MSSPLTEMIVELVASGRISAAQLQQALDGCAARPRRTHAQHYQRALAQCPAPSLSMYKTNFGRLAERYGQTPLEAVTTAQLVSRAVNALDKW